MAGLDRDRHMISRTGLQPTPTMVLDWQRRSEVGLQAVRATNRRRRLSKAPAVTLATFASAAAVFQRSLGGSGSLPVTPSGRVLGTAATVPPSQC